MVASAFAHEDVVSASAGQSLPYPTTLDYEAIKVDIRPPNFRIKERDELVALRIRQMRVQNASDEEIATFKRQAASVVPPSDPPSRERLRIGFAANAIVYDHRFSERENRGRPVVWITSVTNDRTLTFVHDSLTVHPLANRSDVFDIPLPGVGIGNLPLLKAGTIPKSPNKARPLPGETWCKVLTQNPETKAFAYENGRVDSHLHDGTPVIDRIRIGPRELPYDDWTFSDYRRENGRLLAHRIVYRLTVNDGPWYETTYTLKSADPKELLGEDAIRKFLKKGDLVQEYDEAGRIAREYRYDPEKAEPLGSAPGMAKAMAVSTVGLGTLLLGVVVLGRRRSSR